MTEYRILLTLDALDPERVDDLLTNLERFGPKTGPVVGVTRGGVDVTLALESSDAAAAVTAAALIVRAALEGFAPATVVAVTADRAED